MDDPRRLLIVDDDPIIRHLVKHLLTPMRFEVTEAGSFAECLQITKDGFEGVVLLDIRLPDGDGALLLPTLRAHLPRCPIIILTGHGTPDIALKALQNGAFDFVLKENIADELSEVVTSAHSVLDYGTDQSSPFANIITQSPAMLTVFQTLMPVLQSNVPVMIRGESGTGKELIAQAIHYGGPRKQGPFVGVNCAGIPENLLEAELFGYERGAFTGAESRKLGRFDLAQGGTLLLDEIAEMQPMLQAKLLRVLQEKEYQRLGGVTTIQSNVRILSATHRNLEEEVKGLRFREDVFYRLAVFTVDLPPLRERRGDVPLLVEFFVKKYATRESKELEGADPLLIELLQSFAFPGNVRQLENVVAHAVVASRGDRLRISDLPSSFLSTVTPKSEQGPQTPNPSPNTVLHSLAFVEAAHIKRVLAFTRGNKAKACRILGISRMTLYRKIKEYGLST